MKLAYISYDLNALKAHASLSRYFSEISYFLVEPERSVPAIDFSQVAVFVDASLIPFETELRTLKHLDTLRKIRPQLEDFKMELFNEAYPRNSATEQNVTLAKQKVESLSKVGDIFFDTKKQKAYLEDKATGTVEFDFVIVENHQLISQIVMNLKNHVQSAPAINSHIWFSVQFTYEFKNPRTGGVVVPYSMIMIQDSANESLVDNWYFCHFDKDLLTIQQWIPFNQHQNLDYQNFMIDRTLKTIESKLDFIHLIEVKNKYVDSTAGFQQAAAVLKNNRLSSLAPSFSFWSAAQIENYVCGSVDQKIKKILKIEASRGVS